jgi:16S rRNA (guanine527-N7)-methyltransferase
VPAGEIRAETLQVLLDAQRLGMLGGRPVEQASDHAAAFAEALSGGLRPGGRLVDLGSGGGLPGLVLADLLADCWIVLVDRREKRTDFLRRAVRRLGHAHVEVRTVDVDAIARDVEAGRERPFDAVTARGFGPPAITLRLARRLISRDGVIVVSEPPTGNRWDPELLADLDLIADRMGPVAMFHVKPD